MHQFTYADILRILNCCWQQECKKNQKPFWWTDAICALYLMFYIWGLEELRTNGKVQLQRLYIFY